MKLLLCFLVLVVLLGPLRRPFFRAWRFTVPACLAGLGSWVFVARFMGPDDPWFMPWAVALVIAVGMGAHGKRWLDSVFDKEK